MRGAWSLRSLIRRRDADGADPRGSHGPTARAARGCLRQFRPRPLIPTGQGRADEWLCGVLRANDWCVHVSQYDGSLTAQASTLWSALISDHCCAWIVSSGSSALGKLRDGILLALGGLLRRRTFLHIHQGAYFDRLGVVALLNVVLAKTVVVPSYYLGARVPVALRRRVEVLPAPGALPVEHHLRRGRPRGHLNLIVVANAVFGKGVPELLRDLRSAALDCTWSLRIVGAPADKREATRIRAELAVCMSIHADAQWTAGEASSVEITRAMDWADIGVIPSTTCESQCLVGVEMLNKGLPVVANELGALPELLEAGGGHTYVQGSPRSLREALMAIHDDYDRYHHEARHAAMNRYSPTRLAEQVVLVFSR